MTSGATAVRTVDSTVVGVLSLEVAHTRDTNLSSYLLTVNLEMDGQPMLQNITVHTVDSTVVSVIVAAAYLLILKHVVQLHDALLALEHAHDAHLSADVLRVLLHLLEDLR